MLFSDIKSFEHPSGRDECSDPGACFGCRPPASSLSVSNPPTPLAHYLCCRSMRGTCCRASPACSDCRRPASSTRVLFCSWTLYVLSPRQLAPVLCFLGRRVDTVTLMHRLKRLLLALRRWRQLALRELLLRELLLLLTPRCGAGAHRAHRSRRTRTSGRGSRRRCPLSVREPATDRMYRGMFGNAVSAAGAAAIADDRLRGCTAGCRVQGAGCMMQDASCRPHYDRQRCGLTRA